MTVIDPPDGVPPEGSPQPAGPTHEPLPRRVLAGYAVGSLVPGAFGTVPGLLLLPYLTDTLGVAAGVAGLLVFVLFLVVVVWIFSGSDTRVAFPPYESSECIDDILS